MSKKNKRQFSRPQAAANPRTEFNPDYSVTKHDLKRTASLWLVLVGVLIVLSFFQKQLLGLFIK